MKSRNKLITNKLWVLAILFIVMLQIISCNSATETTPITAVPQPTNPPLESTAKPVLNGEEILQDSIASVNEIDAYKMRMITGGDFGEGNVNCSIVREGSQYICQHDIVLASGDRDQSIYYQGNNNAWYKEYPIEESWIFVSDGFKTGYSGINNYDLI